MGTAGKRDPLFPLTAHLLQRETKRARVTVFNSFDPLFGTQLTNRDLSEACQGGREPLQNHVHTQKANEREFSFSLLSRKEFSWLCPMAPPNCVRLP